MIPVGSIISWTPPGARSSQDRVLSYDYDHNRVALINIRCRKAKIRVFATTELERLFKEGNVLIAKRDLEKSQTQTELKYKEEVWKDTEEFRKDDSYLFDCHLRKTLVLRAMLRSKKSEPTVRLQLRRLLQAGSIKEDIRSQYSKCGKTDTGKIYTKKRGRKKKYVVYPSAVLTEQDKATFELIIKAYLMGLINRHVSRRFVYKNYLIPVYQNKHEAQCDKNSNEHPAIPSFDQFNKYIKASGASKRITDSRQTKAQKGTSGRAKNSEDTLLEPFGPGDIYLIDSTKASIYLINNESLRRIIGKPTVYLVVDAFSSMIIGYHSTLASPCYEEGCLALINVFENKEEICKRYDIKYVREEWATGIPLPGTLIADRQEFMSKNSNLLLEKLNVSVVHPTKYRGDWKAHVESALGMTEKVTWTFPGADDPDTAADEKDPKLDACLTKWKFDRMMWNAIIDANARLMKNKPIPKGAAEAETLKTPVELMQWGLDQICGMGCVATLADVRRKLLPLANTAHTYAEGIRVSARNAIGLYYFCPEIPKKYFEPGATIPLTVQFDPRSMDYIYIEHPDTGEVVVGYLSKRSKGEYEGLSWEEGASYQDRMKQKATEKEKERDDASRSRNQLINSTGQSAVDAARKIGPVTQSSMTQGIERNRRETHALELSSRPKACPPPPSTLQRELQLLPSPGTGSLFTPPEDLDD